MNKSTTLLIWVILILLISGCINQENIEIVRQKIRELPITQEFSKGYSNVEVNLTLYDREYVKNNFITGDDVCSVSLNSSLGQNIGKYYMVELLSNNIIVGRGFLGEDLRTICFQRIEVSKEPETNKVDLKIEIVDSVEEPLRAVYDINVKSDGNTALQEKVNCNIISPPCGATHTVSVSENSTNEIQVSTCLVNYAEMCNINCTSKKTIIATKGATAKIVMFCYDNEEAPYPHCGDNICQENEKYWCLDCPINCQGQYCNSKIDIKCIDCLETDEELLPILFEYENTIYDCLSDYFTYHPSRRITYIIKPVHHLCEDVLCERTTAYFVLPNCSIYQDGFFGVMRQGETSINEETIEADTHEMIHAFTSYALSDTPKWFNEGISEYIGENILCHPSQNKPFPKGFFNLGIKSEVPICRRYLDRMCNIDEVYELLRSGQAIINEYSTDPHYIGAIFFYALKKDYNCDEFCMQKVFYSLYQYRNLCQGSCLENAKTISDEYFGLHKYTTSPSADIWLPVITNSTIKQKAEEVVGEDLTSLFVLLGIKYD